MEQVTPIPEDASLIYEAETKATGANIHRIRNALAAYRMACYLGEKEGSIKEAENLRALLY